MAELSKRGVSGQEVTDLNDLVRQTVDPDAGFGELRRRYETDDLLRMDGTVFNVTRGQVETV